MSMCRRLPTLSCAAVLVLCGCHARSGHSSPGDEGDVVPGAVDAAALLINDGAPFTRNLDVILNLDCLNCSDVLVANDAECAAGSYEPFTPTRSWRLTRANVVNTVFARFRSPAGLETDCLSARIRHDDLPPTPVLGVDDGDWVRSLDRTPEVYWGGGAEDDGSLLADFELSVGTSAEAADVSDWTSVGIVFFSTVTGLSLGDGAHYVVSVRAVDHAGNVSAATSGDGFRPDLTAPFLSVVTPNDGQQVSGLDVTVQGLCEVGMAVVVAPGAGMTAAPVVGCPSGAYSLLVTMTGSLGARTLAVSQTDPAGNVTTATRDFLYGISAPTLTRIDRFAGADARWGQRDGVGSDARFWTPAGLAVSGDTLWVADRDGHTIRKVELLTGAVTTVAGSSCRLGCSDGVGANALLSGPTGLLLVGTDLFISSECNAIHRLDTITGQVTMIAGGAEGDADGIGFAARFHYPAGMATDGTYLFIADRSGNRIRRMHLTTLAVTTVAGSATGLPDYVNSQGLAARFDHPGDIAMVGTDLFVADEFNCAIRRMDSSFNVTTFAGQPPPGHYGHEDGIGTNSSFSGPSSVVTDGIYLFVSGGNHDIRRIELATAMVTTVAGRWWDPPGLIDGSVAAAQFSNPHQLAVSGGVLWVSDREDHVLRKVDLGAGLVTTFAGNRSPTAGPSAGYVNGVGPAALLHEPGQGVVIGDILYFADTLNHAVRSISIPGGEVTPFAGGYSWFAGALDGGPVTALFHNPNAVATDGVFLYVGDYGSCTIRRIDLVTATTVTIVGTADDCGYVNATGPAAKLGGPASAVVMGSRLYLADGENCAIRSVDLGTFAVSTLAGAEPPGACGYVEGAAAAARFRYVDGITTDGVDLFVTDSNNHRIRRIDPATGVTTLVAGSGSWGFTDGAGASAELDSPRGITWDGSHLYFVEGDNNALRRVDPATGVVTTVFGNGFVPEAEIDGPFAVARFMMPDEIVASSHGIFVTSAGQNWRWIH